VESDDQKILFSEWGVKRKFAFPNCRHFLAKTIEHIPDYCAQIVPVSLSLDMTLLDSSDCFKREGQNINLPAPASSHYFPTFNKENRVVSDRSLPFRVIESI